MKRTITHTIYNDIVCSLLPSGLQRVSLILKCRHCVFSTHTHTQLSTFTPLCIHNCTLMDNQVIPGVKVYVPCRWKIDNAELCGQQFHPSQASDFYGHLLTHADEILDVHPTPKLLCQWEGCIFNGHEFKRRSLFRNHVARTHNPYTLYLCEVMKFTSLSCCHSSY
jgi:hypothetical protein